MVPVSTSGDSWASSDAAAPTRAQAGVPASELIAVAGGVGTTAGKQRGVQKTCVQILYLAGKLWNPSKPQFCPL